MSIQEHMSRQDNPHGVTKAQVGLDNVMNYPMASAAEISALAANDRYIRLTDIGLVNEAFTQYMQDIGLMDANGEIIRSPVDTDGDVTFEVDTYGNVLLEGSHPAAHTVDVSVTQASELVFSEDKIEIVSNQWSANVSTLVLDPDLPYSLALVYRDISGKQLSRSDVVTGDLDDISEGNINFTINDDNWKGTLSGNTSGAVTVDVRIEENGELVYTGTNIPVDTVNNNFWIVNTGNVTFDPTAHHDVTVIGKDATETAFGQHSITGTNIAEISNGPAMTFAVNPDNTGSLDGYIPGAVRVAVSISEDGIDIFNDTQIATNPANGYWSADLSGVTFNRDADIATTVKGYDSNDVLIYQGNTKANKVPLNPDQGTLITYDESQGIYYYDFRNFSNWENVAVDWVDYGLIGGQ